MKKLCLILICASQIYASHAPQSKDVKAKFELAKQPSPQAQTSGIPTHPGAKVRRRSHQRPKADMQKTIQDLTQVINTNIQWTMNALQAQNERANALQQNVCYLAALAAQQQGFNAAAKIRIEQLENTVALHQQELASFKGAINNEAQQSSLAQATSSSEYTAFVPITYPSPTQQNIWEMHPGTFPSAATQSNK